MRNHLILSVLFFLFCVEQSLAQNVHLSAGLLTQERGEPLRDVAGEEYGGRTISKLGVAISFPLSEHADIRYEYTHYSILGTISEGIAFQGLSIEVKLF